MDRQRERSEEIQYMRDREMARRRDGGGDSERREAGNGGRAFEEVERLSN